METTKEEELLESEYLVLKTLEESNNKENIIRLKEKVRSVSERLESKGHQSPIKFAVLNRKDSLRSPNFSRALSRLTDLRAIKRQKDNVEITDEGRKTLERRKDSISEDLNNSIEEAFN